MTAFGVNAIELVDGDYIELDGPTSQAEVVRVLSTIVGDPGSHWSHTVFPLLTLQDRTEVVVDFDHDGLGSACLAIGNPDGNVSARHDMARRIYRGLSTTTSWRLDWTTDDASAAKLVC